jgi:hypothetical protein
MDLPNLQAGMAILADQINQISREVRSNAITAFNGGKFQRTTGGTSLSIDQGINPNSGGTVSCPFRITNASTDTTKKIRIAQNTVNVNTGARWPQGMGPTNPPYEVTFTATSYVYIKLVYVTDDVIVKPDEDAITVAVETSLQTNTVDEEYVLIGIVAVDGDKVTITNQCTAVTANPCNLAWGA